MKVTNNGPNGLQQLDSAKTKKVGSDKAGDVKQQAHGAEAFAGSAKVDLSPRAQEAKKIKEVAMAAPDIDEAKVARLQALIDKGEYKVDAQSIADRLVDEHLMLPS